MPKTNLQIKKQRNTKAEEKHHLLTAQSLVPRKESEFLTQTAIETTNTATNGKKSTQPWVLKASQSKFCGAGLVRSRACRAAVLSVLSVVTLAS